MNLTDGTPKNGTMHDWLHSMGKTGDLADIIVATLSLASVNYGVSKVRFSEFYELFARLEEEFPSLIPKLGAKQTGGDTYSKTLATALESALRLGVRIANPRFQFLEVPRPIGQRNLERLQKRAGEKFIEDLKDAAKYMANRVNKESDVIQ